MTKVLTANHPTDAHLAVGFLESHGIKAVVQGAALFSARGEVPVTPDTLPSVWVENEADAARARQLLDDANATP